MRRTVACALWSLAAVGCASSALRPADEPRPLTQSPAAQRQAALRARVDALLARPSSAPEDWKALGPEALTILQQIANDPASAPAQGERAVAAMERVDSADARAVLESYAKDPHQATQVRGAAVLALGGLGGPASLALAKALLDDPSPALRRAAAGALGRVSGPEAKEALEARLEKEDDASVRDALQRSLTAQQP